MFVIKVMCLEKSTAKRSLKTKQNVNFEKLGKLNKPK